MFNFYQLRSFKKESVVEGSNVSTDIFFFQNDLSKRFKLPWKMCTAISFIIELQFNFNQIKIAIECYK